MTAMRRVSRSRPCEQCKKTDWCLYGVDALICMRTPSPKPKVFSDGSTGWVHMTGSRPLPPLARKSEPQTTLSVEDTLKRWKRTAPGNRSVDDLANILKLSADSLRMLDCMQSDQVGVWAFPMRGGNNGFTGIRLRSESGKKWSVVGSHPGLFLPQCEAQQEAIICEGPTDTAAALTMGAFAIGRPSCNGGVADLIAAIKRLRIRRVTIVADCDKDRERDNGQRWNPGLDGARALSKLLPIPNRIVTLPCKDLRDFVRRGGDIATFNAIANQLVWNKPQ